jgi:hypothetical protein
MKKINAVYGAALLLTISVACKHEPFEPEPNPAAIPVSTTSPTDTTKENVTPIDTVTYNAATVYFVNDIQPILTTECALPGCHNHESKLVGIDMSSYDRIIKTTEVEPGQPDKGKLVRVLKETNPSRRMPPSGPLLPAEIDMIENWIIQGAKNNFYLQKCDTVTLTFANDILAIFDNNCNACHSGSTTNGGYDLSAYVGIKRALDSNLLPGVIEHASGYKAMPPSIKLNDCDISKIKRWILNGAPNN